MKVIKRNGTLVDFDRIKIENAILAAMKDLGESYVNNSIAKRIARDIEKSYFKEELSLTVIGHKDNPNPLLDSLKIPIQEIEDKVEEKLMSSQMKDVARRYIRYRYKKQMSREVERLMNKRNKSVLELINGENDYLNRENSNKNATVLSTQRDYMAGEVSKEICEKFLFDSDLMKAHTEGIIHIHDCDFSAQKMHNCDLVNLEDMLQNGTCLSQIGISKPKSFATAATLATQIVMQVAANQYGGQTISLTHLAPFVRISRDKYRRRYSELGFNKNEVERLVEDSLQKEITSGIQTIQYQLITYSGVQGQSPFVSLFMYLGETEEYKEELAMLIEEVIKQRIKGIPNKQGQPITTAFPKLLYVLEEDNIHEDSPYWYLTQLAVECSSKRLVPDYISEKKMKELKEGNCFPCMGCVDGKEVITYKFNDFIYVESFERMWFKFSQLLEVKLQPNHKDEYIDLNSVEIYDTKVGFTKCYRLIRNTSNKWVDLNFNNGRRLLCTENHPFETENRGVVLAKDLINTDTILVNYKPISALVCEKKKEFYKLNTFKETNEEVTYVKEKCFITKEQYSYDVTTESEHFEVSGIYSHNCRSFLQPYYDGKGNPKFYGRFNQGVVTLNLVDIALTSHRDIEKFWRVLEERTNLCYRALMTKHKQLKGTLSDVAPILWQDGALARLEPGETIDNLLFNDYSSISLGYAGLYECIKFMTGKSHTDETSKKLAIQVMNYLNDKCKEWKAETHIGFSLYGSPIESTTYKFAQTLQKRFGEIKGITDKDYITNSYHINVKEEVDAFAKLSFESEFQALSLGGAISYIEVPNMQKNLSALIKIVQFIYDNIMYAEINTKSDYCQKCGYEGEMLIDDNMDFYCPQCNNHDFSKMNVARRVCGYISTNPFNKGRTQDIKERYLHLGNE